MSGGKILRMGQDKAQIEFRGQTLISSALAFLLLNFTSVLIAGDRHPAGEAGGFEAQEKCPGQHQGTGGKCPLRLCL
jgi:molybdopterin-guanine dinucleotide biosynthesis protein A